MFVLSLSRAVLSKFLYRIPRLVEDPDTSSSSCIERILPRCQWCDATFFLCLSFLFLFLFFGLIRVFCFVFGWFAVLCFFFLFAALCISCFLSLVAVSCFLFLVAIFNRLLSAINVWPSLSNNIFGGRLGNHYWHVTVTPNVPASVSIKHVEWNTCSDTWLSSYSTQGILSHLHKRSSYAWVWAVSGRTAPQHHYAYSNTCFVLPLED